MSRDFQLPGRSPVIACEGMAATSHPFATLAAVDALRAGGSAADAAVAAVAALCVIEPHMTGIGGDCFCLVSQPGKPVWGYNGSGRAGAKASDQALRAKGLSEIGNSIHAVTVPGAIEAWEAILKAHGRFGLDRALAPAIKYAEGGFPVAARVAWDWQRHVGKLKADPGASKHYLFNGAAPKEGDVIRFPALAATLKTIAAKGARAFYEGEIADDMANTLGARASFLTTEDFFRHRGEAVKPISTNYRGLDLVEIPPNTQGLTALVMLNILENFDLAALDPFGADRFHLVLEAARLGYAIRDTHIADQAHMRTTVADLLDKKFAKKLASLIDMKKRAKVPSAPAPGNDTVYLTVVDRGRMAVSIINSLYSSFGLGICTEKS
ncbi:MAG: gamma-glutamyltransferase, partial [Pseudolabrys sp.]